MTERKDFLRLLEPAQRKPRPTGRRSRLRSANAPPSPPMRVPQGGSRRKLLQTFVDTPGDRSTPKAQGTQRATWN